MRLADISPATWIAIGLGLRMALLGWGTYQDANGPLPYTDIDYQVFTSAASYLYDDCPVQLIAAQDPEEEYENLVDPPLAKGRCAQGYIPAAARLMIQMEKDFLTMDKDIEVEHSNDSVANFMTDLVPTVYKSFKPIFRLLAGLGNPYRRETYRYTPLLALLLTPAEALADNGYWPDAVQGLFGKLLFVLADIIIALLLWDIMDIRSEAQSANSKASKKHGWLVGLLWLANPFAAQISTRGSSESVLGVLVLGFLDVTIRGYPERYLPTIAARPKGKKVSIAGYLPDPSRWSNERVLAPLLFALAIHWKLYPIIYAAALVPHLINSESFRAVIRYGAISVYCLALICGTVYALWGMPYLQETFFYHLNRTDHRHNFSPFFLPAYLSTQLPASLTESKPLLDLFQSIQPILGFVPQLLATAYIGFSIGGQDLIAALTFQTMAFVALNKVCTSQYFMWFLWFLPLIGPHLSFPGGKGELFTLIGVWVSAQALWLSQAYLLEFKALDTYTRTWIASLIVLAAHTLLILRLINAWSLARLQAQKIADKASTSGKQKALPASIEEEKE
jgi:GPI mannosyltransferase 1 subunit M